MRKRFMYKRFIVFFLALLVPLITLSTAFAVITGNNVRQSLEKNTNKLLNMTNTNLQLMIESVSFQQKILGENPRLALATSKLFGRKSMSYEDVIYLNMLKAIISAPMKSNRNVVSAYLYVENLSGTLLTDEGILSLSEMTDTGWLKVAQSDFGKTRIEARDIPADYSGQPDKAVITLYQKIVGMKGALVTNLDAGFLETVWRENTAYAEECILITGMDGTIVFENKNMQALRLENDVLHAIQSGAATILTPDGEYLLNEISTDAYSLRYFSAVPHKVIYASLENLFALTLVAAALALILSFLMAFFYTRQYFNQVGTIIDAFSAAEEGRELPRTSIKIRDEHDLILQNVVGTFIKSSFLRLQLSEREHKMRLAENTALQMQINPHFLFNTLQSIESQLYRLLGRPNEVNPVLQDLCAVLRYSLSRADTMATLGDELENIRRYVRIQHFRYGDKFHLMLDCDDSLLPCPIFHVCLQPLVENSLYHGIKPHPGEGRLLKIKVQDCGQRLRIWVMDNGVGLEKEKVLALNHSFLSDSTDIPETHIGMSNLNLRLRFTFGDESRLFVRSRPGMGTVVQFYIPLSR